MTLIGTSAIHLCHISIIMSSSAQDIASRPLLGKVAIVSGASQGIGAAIAAELSRQGANVTVNYPWAAEKQRAEQVIAGFGVDAPKSIVVEADLSTVDGPRFLAEEAVKTFGKIDILVNNVGLYLPVVMSSTPQISDDELLDAWDKIINLNGRGTYFLTRAVLKHLAKESRIINIGSGVSRAPDEAASIYSGTKGMIESFTRTWAVDLPRKYDCTVNTIAPGATATEAFLNAPEAIRNQLAPIIASTPRAPRAGTPDEISYLVAAIAHPKASWINGAWIPVTGGMVLN